MLESWSGEEIMSNFRCEICDIDILDTEKGYIAECEHYPIEVVDPSRDTMEAFIKAVDQIGNLDMKPKEWS